MNLAKSTFALLMLSAILSPQELFATSTEATYPITSYQVYNYIEGVQSPYISLSGEWEFNYDGGSKYEKVVVPGELAMQGYAIEHNKPYYYKKSFTLPSDYKGKRVILRFDGVYSYAKLSVNGKFVRSHAGGFTRWESDITEFVKAGRKNEITLEVIDPIDDISYASGYAHHPIGGILREVAILAQPTHTLENFYLETDLDEAYDNATLNIGYTPNLGDDTQIKVSLSDPSGNRVELPKNILGALLPETYHQLAIDSPIKWDAEHPNLYELTIDLLEQDRTVASLTKKVGFRKIEIKEDQMLVNGVPVKLRGACRHDIYPTLGRTTTPYFDSLDVVRFKESNMNYVRTSHYPPSEAFVNYCDQMGIYVECETAVCFISTHRQKNYHPYSHTQDSVDFSHRYLAQCEEMVRTFRSNSSILFWSVGNECVYGTNFQASYDLVKGIDTTRPVIFSYPGTVKDAKVYDILSMHYQDVYGNLNQWGIEVKNFQHTGIPTVFDEWAHPACYTYKTLQDDPNIREFWGRSLDMMWSGLYNSRGGLGGAIWGYIDETFMLPQPSKGDSYWKEFARTAKPEDFQGNCVGYGEWGIVDVWRREKPEFWATKKAYSPVKVMNTSVERAIQGQPIVLSLYNRYDHTNLNELTMNYVVGTEEFSLAMPDVEPRQKSFVVLPSIGSYDVDYIDVSFTDQYGVVVDRERITIGKEKVELPDANHSARELSIEENTTHYIVKGADFEIPFNKNSGLIENAISFGKVFIEKGPIMHLGVNLNHLSGAEVRKSATSFEIDQKSWQKKSMIIEPKDGAVECVVKGSYDMVEMTLYITILPQGTMQLTYHIEGHPNGYLREAGLKFQVSSDFNHLSWLRRGYWSCYPQNSMSPSEGQCYIDRSEQVAYGKKPRQDWAFDTHNYYYWADRGANVDRPLTQMAKAMKENIYSYTLSKDNTTKESLAVVDQMADVACRIEKMPSDELMLYVNNQWDYPEIAWGNFCKIVEAQPLYGTITLQF